MLVSQLLGAVLFRRLIADQPMSDDFIDQLTATALTPAAADATSSPRHPDSTDEHAPTKDPMTTNIAIITFPDPDTADDAFTAACTLHGVRARSSSPATRTDASRSPAAPTRRETKRSKAASSAH